MDDAVIQARDANNDKVITVADAAAYLRMKDTNSAFRLLKDFVR